jgi:hypothetical protein
LVGVVVGGGGRSVIGGGVALLQGIESEGRRRAALRLAMQEVVGVVADAERARGGRVRADPLRVRRG